MNMFNWGLSLILGLVLGHSFSSVLYAASHPVSPEKRASILELMQLEGQKENAIEMYQEIFTTFKTSNNNVPVEAWEEIKAETNTELLLESIEAIYDKYLSLEDIKNLITFRKSSIGQRFSRVQGAMTQEIAKACSLWGQKLAINIQKKLWDKNIEFDVYDTLDEYDSCDATVSMPAIPAKK